ncbi:hypothetical protein ZIOFF_004629 [Zingiber officinale]|uniref:Uncharacterized protein n=1 Tax=Zingiber officinale TaxID=94328 RepID=A0A8J5HLF7_ZINOF|nr:hypothetical protein ZIOFF_004629 [Zingiber officinale]
MIGDVKDGRTSDVDVNVEVRGVWRLNGNQKELTDDVALTDVQLKDLKAKNYLFQAIDRSILKPFSARIPPKILLFFSHFVCKLLLFVSQGRRKHQTASNHDWILTDSLGMARGELHGCLVGKAADRIVQQFGEQHGVEEDLKKLKDSLANAMLQISTIENLWLKDKNLQQRLKELLIGLKDAAYDADDLLDEFQYRILKQQIEQQGDERMREIKGGLDDNSVALEKIYSSLGAEDDRGKKQLVSWDSRQTSCFSTEPQLFGRDKDLQELKDLLLKREIASKFGQSGFSVLSIAGIGGIGKTTLASSMIVTLTREIIEYATKQKCDITTFALLQEILKKKITPERFLLVLGDVWNDDRHKWESLCEPLRSGKPGSKILVTTRSRQIANMVGDVDPIHLEGLNQWSFWEFFKKCAFGSSNSGVHHPHLEAMVEKMTCKLKGLPLAAKTLGGLLSNFKLDEQYWKNILDSEIWELPQDKNGVLPVLQLSYQHLPHLKQCFAFCSLFPKDYRFSESELIRPYICKSFILDCGVLLKLKKIHVLELKNCALEELPDSIGKLIHLRSLNLSYNYTIRKLPESLCDLYNLQSLILNHSGLEELPGNIGKLIYLRYID